MQATVLRVTGRADKFQGKSREKIRLVIYGNIIGIWSKFN